MHGNVMKHFMVNYKKRRKIELYKSRFILKKAQGDWAQRMTAMDMVEL